MLRKLNQKDFKTMPWKNGKGFTSELYRIDHDSEMLFRVSSAKVEQSGPFSDFSGYDRTLVNLGPGLMEINITGQEKQSLSVLQSCHFDGGLSTDCTVTSPCEDLNIFCRQGRFFASTIVRALKKPEFIPLLPDAGWLIFVATGELCAHGPGGRELLVQAGGVLLQDLGTVADQDRLMLASSSETVCDIVAIAFRPKLN